MERLTRRSDNGVGIYNTSSGDPVKWENNRNRVLQKLADYEDLEEQGLLLKLPCKVGDWVYVIKENGNIDPHKIVTVEISEDGAYFKSSYCFGRLKDFGKTIFLSQAEAEEALKRMEGK